MMTPAKQGVVIELSNGATISTESLTNGIELSDDSKAEVAEHIAALEAQLKQLKGAVGGLGIADPAT